MSKRFLVMVPAARSVSILHLAGYKRFYAYKQDTCISSADR
nr:MAG TPA: hypothetical protein [Caudoviricetes sp.]